MRDVLIVCCDGLTGFPEAIEATWPQATVQTCVVHLIRAAMRFVNWADRKAVAAALKPIYTAANADGALIELDAFEMTPLGKEYPSTIKAFRDAWERFTPFLAFPPALRRVIYTTNSSESATLRLPTLTTTSFSSIPPFCAGLPAFTLATCAPAATRAAGLPFQARRR